MVRSLTIIGAPSSAGSYAPGQEKTPASLRAAGLVDLLRAGGLQVYDAGDVTGFRWRADRSNPRAMNVVQAARVAREVSVLVEAALTQGRTALVIGGDCTVELGTVRGSQVDGSKIGLVYIDLDTDLNTPASTTDGALDWMGVAHLLALPDCRPELANLGTTTPMLRPDQVHFFADDNVKPFERQVISDLEIPETRLTQVAIDPTGAAREVVQGWASRFDRLLVHLDTDVLDFVDFPLSENTRRYWGLRLDQLMEALLPFAQAPNLAALTITEINPDHGEQDGSTLRIFIEQLAQVLAST